ncbi:MAG: DUF1150 family protein [Micavibrio sp.]
MNTGSQNNDAVRAMLKALSPHDFLQIGINEVAYVRPVPMEGIAQEVFGIYAADGTQISLLESREMALATLRHHDLVAVTLH